MTTAPLGYSSEELAARGAQHTAREILQQPALWLVVARAAADRRQETETFLRPLLRREDLRIVLTGAGTSAFVGEILAPGLTAELHHRVDAVPTTDIVSDPQACFPQDQPTLLVSFARSGDSPESVAAAALADQCLSEVHHLVLTCNPDGELHRRHVGASRSLVLLMPEPANDQGFAMTSSFTSMLLTAQLTFGRSAPDHGLVERLSAAGEQVLARHSTSAQKLAQGGFERLVYLGSGALTGLAHESALKLLELTAGGVVTYFDSALGFRHGPKAVLDDRTLALVYLSNDHYTRQYDVDIVRELRRTLGPDRVVAITAQTLDEVPGGDSWPVEGLVGASDAALALPFILCAQLLGLHFSLAMGRTPDNPFPSGEVNRVVRGVTIHPFTP